MRDAMRDVWSERAELYRESEAHRQGPDLDLLVAWAAGARTALDVASGGGHVARRLREAGLQTVTVDRSPGMEPDVIASAEDLPFAEGSFDVVVCRLAGHHFPDLEAAVREMARVARERVLVVDTLYLGERAEEAERLRDPTHVRNRSEEEWRALFVQAGLTVEEARILAQPIALGPWLARCGCQGEEAERVRALLADRIEGGLVRLERIALKGRKR
jgi:SAM-dependent methyltransferase